MAGEGHRTLLASDGNEAYEVTLAQGPDLVFLEKSMPVFDGFETCEMIRNDPGIAPELPLILVTGDKVDAKRVERAGISEVVAESELTLRIRDLLVEHLGPKAVPDREE